MEKTFVESDYLPPPLPKKAMRISVAGKLIFIAILVVLLQIPLFLINGLQQERRQDNTPAALKGRTEEALRVTDARPEFIAYRMVERALKYGVLVLALVFAAFFLFETLCGLRLHAVHYGLVGAAMCLFYLALLALGEVVAPGIAYAGAAVASSALIVSYSASILRSAGRAAVVAVLLGAVHAVLYVVLRMESFALLAGTTALFVALGAVMYLTRNIDWHAQEEATAVAVR
jgi:inner membrane protein involved in colicin E2 resistance